MRKVCPKAFVRKEPCINGKRNLKITNYYSTFGKCRPFQSTTSVFCESEKKQFCKCNVVDNLHYRTYDGQRIHFSGGCRYTLTRYNRRGDSCSFNIEVENEYRDGNKHLSHTKSVIIHMFGERFELGQHKTLKVGNIQRSIPYEKGEDVKIFHSNNFVQFVAPKCSVHVAFDKNSNAFIEVSKRYSKKIIGICGDCNGIQDDLKTKSGKDVSKNKDKYSRIANSYKINYLGRYCTPAEHVSYKSICRYSFIEKAKARNFCSAIVSSNSPFSKCGQHAHVDLKNFYEDCLIDMCANKNRRLNPKHVQCKTLGVLSEVCAESGIPGIKWRTHFQCPTKCGENEHFTHKASPCPRTCENHFFESRRPCYDLPEREGCECNKGYIRDGALCVKPMHCSCINLCIDRKGSRMCWKWKAQGDCEKFPEPMNIMCRKTCNFCKSPDESCENEISTKQCLLFRRQGLCFDDFYSTLCGLTCNYDKCKCGDDKVIVEKCNANYIITTTHYSFARDSNGRCVKTVKQTYRSCCPNSWTNHGNCNLCTGKRNITMYSYDVVKMKCVLRSNTRYETCQKCQENVREKRECIGEKYLKITVYFNKLIGCFQCVPDQRISTTEIKCKTTTVVKRINRNTECTTIFKRTQLNCQCRTHVTRKCCSIRCPRSKTTKYCENGKFIYRTLSYKHDCICIPQYSYRIEIPKCQPKRPTIGGCEKTKNKLFYCKAIETQYTANVNANCKCIRNTVKHERTCCCKEPHQYEKCNRNTGLLTTFNVTYQPVWRGKDFHCVKRLYENSVLIIAPPYIIKRGDCKPNLMQTVEIFRKFRDGCEIKSSSDKYEEICGCPKQIFTRKICVFNREIFERFKKVLVNAQCVDNTISNQEIPIICPNDQKIKSKCFHERKSVTTISYHKYKCKCIKKVKKQIITCRCRDRTISEQTLKCNLNTCKQKHIVHIKRNCKSEKLVYYYACCCKPPIIKTNHCSSITGLITTTTETFYVVQKKSKCFSRTVSSVTKPNCNNVKVIKQKCGQERINYKKITTIRQILSKQTCSCKTVTTSIWKCCKLPKSTVTKSCRGNYFLVKVVKYKFDVNKIKCISQTSQHVKGIHCPTIKVPFQTKYLPKCQYKQTTFYYKIQNCKCELREHSEIYYYSCCEKKPPTVKCVDHNKEITTFTTFQLSSNRKQCIEYVKESTKKIFCQKSKESRKIDISNCKYNISTDYYQVRNCKCQKYNTKIEKKLSCCEQPPLINISCLDNKIWRETTTKYTLENDEKCIEQKSHVDIIKKCSTAYAIVCPCPGNPKLKSIKYHYYVTVNCKCVHRIKLVPCPCHKIPNKIEIGQCKNKQETVKIFKSVNVNEDCKWELLKSYQDVCKCTKRSIIKTCLKHSIYRTTTITYTLVTVPNQYPTHTCVESKIIKDEIIECNKNYIQYGNCINCRQSVTECEYRTVNCKCVMYCHITYRPCEWWKLNHCNLRCIRNIKYSFCYKYKAGPSKCVLDFISKIPIPEKCSSQTNIQCRELNYPINNCYYKSCKKSFDVYKNCRCEPRTETTDTIIRAREPIRQIRCINNRRILKITKFIIKHNQCPPEYQEKIIKIECPRWKVLTTKKHGYTHYQINYYKIENCECIQKICRGPYFKQECPFSKLYRGCSRNNQWVYTHIVRQIQFTNIRFCPESDSPFREQICVENRNTRIEPINCPNSYDIITCIVSRNIKRIEKHYYKVDNCRCVKAVTVDTTLPCKECKNSTTYESKCLSLNTDGVGYVEVTRKYWKITQKNTCEQHIHKSKRICCIGKIRKISECVNGRKLFKTIIINKATECKPRISIISESIPCYNNGRPNKWIKRIHYCIRPGEFTIKYLARKKFNPTNCACIDERESIKIDICCNPCHYRTVCRHNNKIVTISYCERSEKLKCINYKIEKSVQLACPPPVKGLIGDCKGTVIRYRIVSYVTIQCKCVKTIKEYIQKKIKDVTKCINEKWVTTHIDYELYRHTCVPKQPQIISTPIICSTIETFKDKRINDCDFSRSYFKKVVSNCRCVDKFVRKEILHYRCCQKPKVSETCINHNTRVVVTTNYNHLNFKCYPIRRESRFTVDCSYLKLKRRINTGRCTYKIEYYYATTKNCKCYRAHKYTRFNLCYCTDHLRPYKEQKCDKDLGRLITFSYTYKVVGEECSKIKSITYLPINCDGRICEKRYGKCIRNTQTIELFCLKRQGCECVKQIFKRHNICCGPMKDSTWTNAGPCEQSRGYYQLISTFALRLNYRINQCTPVVIKQQYKVCCCRKSFVHKSCFKNIYIKTRKYSYSINFLKNAHDERIDESITLIPRCSKALNFTLSERETTPDGWCIRTNKIVTPVNCKCLERIEETRFRCPCYKPVSVKIKIYCRKNYIIITEKHSPRCRLYNVYWTIDKTITPILNCKYKEILYSDTFYYTWHRRSLEKKCCTESRFETHRQWYVENCKCRSKDIEKRLVCMKSLPPRQREQCLGSTIRVISYSYPIVNGICKRIIDEKLIDIPCPSQPKIHRSECVNNKYTITTTYYFYDKCRCESRVEKRTCDCHCNKDSKIIKCSGNYFLNEITTKYYRKDCRCLESVNIIKIEPSCPRFNSQIIGNCEIEKRHSIYRIITNRQIKKDYKNCKCLIVNNHKDDICDCKKQTRKREICLNNNNFVIQTWGWKINIDRNRCVKVLLNSDSKIISCPPMRINKVCNYNIGKGKETTIKYQSVNCKCIENKDFRTIPCICRNESVLKQRGECLSNNIRIDVYSHKEPRGQHCVAVNENKYIICRCKKTFDTKFCVNDAFVTVTTSYKLINNKCQENQIKTAENLKCSTNIEKIESKCHENGYKTIEYYKLAVYNCKCMRTRIKLEFCSCKCPENKSIEKCNKSGQLLIDIYYTYKIVNCKCQKFRTDKITPINCPKNSKTVSDCNEVFHQHFWFKTTTITEYNIHRCKCIETVKISKSICKSNDSLIISTTCDREKKTEIREVIRMKFENDKFVTTKTIEKIPITCNDNWIIAKKSVCHHYGLYGTEIIVYHRLVFDNCKCVLKIKNIKSDCRCTGPSKPKECVENIIRTYHYDYKLVNFKCERRIIKEESEKVYCESKILKTSSCYQKDNQCVRDVERQDSSLSNCQCSGRKKTIQEICHSCCDAPPSTEKYCEESSNKFITKVSSCRVSLNGFIKNSLEIKEQDIPCKVGSHCVSVDVCNRQTSTETLKCTTTYLQNCVCSSRTEIMHKSCVCGPPELEYGACDKTSLTRAVYEIENRLISLINDKVTCNKEKKKIRDETCDCRKSVITKECINNRMIQKNNEYKFNKELKTCDLKISETDVTESCGPAFDKSTKTCDPVTNKTTIKIKTKKIINCKCITTEKIETELCRCEDRTETKCIADKFLETTVYTFTMDAEKKNCIPSVTQNRKEKVCSVIDIDPDKFYENNYEQCKKVVYEAKNCQCVQSTTPQKCACSLSCPGETVSTACVDGKIKTTTTKNKLDNINCKCVTNIQTDDKLINCTETPKIEYATNKKEYENGIYDIVTNTSERKENCECVKKSSTTYKLISCSNNYQRIKIPNSIYDYKCESPKPPPVVETKCLPDSNISLSNGRFNVTTYKIINDKCVSDSNIVPCSECTKQYCAENRESCIGVKCNEEAEAQCPITCKICEPCPSNARDCETNPFDKNLYRRINILI